MAGVDSTGHATATTAACHQTRRTFLVNALDAMITSHTADDTQRHGYRGAG
jgi:hypothetical protein